MHPLTSSTPQTASLVYSASVATFPLRVIYIFILNSDFVLELYCVRYTSASVTKSEYFLKALASLWRVACVQSQRPGLANEPEPVHTQHAAGVPCKGPRSSCSPFRSPQGDFSAPLSPVLYICCIRLCVWNNGVFKSASYDSLS